MKITAALFVLIPLLISCSASKRFTAIESGQVTDIVRFEPISYITLIERGNLGTYSDSLSMLTKKSLAEAIETFDGRLPLSSEIISYQGDTVLRDSVINEVYEILAAIGRSKTVHNIKIPPRIDSLLTANGKRFGLLLVQAGFSRRWGNYGIQTAKGVGIAILSLGMYYELPIKSSSILHAVIVDNQEKNISFYRRSFLQEREPTDKKTLIQHINRIFNGYFLDN